MSWWLATFGAQKDAYQASSASAAQARHPTWTIAGPFASRAAALGNATAPPPSSSAAPAAPVTQSGGCGAQAIYTALLAAGFSTAQAVGAMANAIAESSLNPETRVIDTNGAYSNGLWQFNEASYPDSGQLITGNCAADITAQVGYLKTHVSGTALNGATGAEVASNFAASFERCQGCGPGGSQNAQRTANAATVQGWITSGSWPTSSATLTAATGGGGGGQAQPQPCLVGPLPHTSFCLLSKAEARGMLGGVMLVAGALLVLPGLIILAAAGFTSTGAGRQVTQAAGMVPGYGRVISAASRRRGDGDEGLEEPTRPGERISESERRTALANRRKLQASRPAPAPKVRAGGSQVSQDFAGQYMS